VSLDESVQHGIRVLLGFALARPMAWEREAATRLRGLRTLPRVSVACCAYILVGISVVGEDPTAHGRLLSGLVVGTGFVGGGAILKADDRVNGTATAASILSTGVLGAAVAYDLFEIALLISITTPATLLVLRPLQRHVARSDDPRRVD